jgi:D-alanyl-lipoteichoic acid acyltransferase DltB (MBOAT superfamily)
MPGRQPLGSEWSSTCKYKSAQRKQFSLSPPELMKKGFRRELTYLPPRIHPGSMLFNSLEFPLFLILLLLLFALLKGNRERRLLLLAASLFFYGYWKWTYLLLLLASSGIDFFAAIAIGNSLRPFQKKLFLWMSLAANLGILCFFKYSAFFGKAFFFDHGEVPEWVPVLLPVGISFYTFQAMAYVIDVFRGRMQAERSWTDYMLFITFFPQLVAGPIERAPHLMEQIKKPFLNPDVLPGLILLASGFFKKLVLADRLGVYADAVFNQPAEASAPQIITATIFFGFQIYGDFSGYSDIAKGCASFFGINLMSNFRSPYLATDLGDFWRRWHISLSGWFRDYLYHPLGGNQAGKARTYFNLFLVFCLSGLWHGANWTFLLWGAWHGAGLVFQRFFQGFFKPGFFLSRVLCLLWVFAGWFIFRVNNLDDAAILLRNSVIWNFENFNLFHSVSEFCLAISGIFILIMSEQKSLKDYEERIRHWSWPLRFAALFTCITALLWLGHFKGGDFIYFQF